MRKHNTETLLAASIVIDGFGTVFFLTSMPFFLVRYGQSSVTAVAFSIGVGGLLGLVASYPMGMLADSLDRRNLLATWQVIQIAVSLPLLFFAAHHSAMVLAVFAAGALAASRAQAVVRDAVRADYIKPDTRISFNTSVRSKFLVANAVASFGALALAGIIPANVYWIFPLVNIASFLVSWLLTRALPDRDMSAEHEHEEAAPFSSRRLISLPMVQTLLALAILPAMADLITVGLSSWIAVTQRFPVYLLTLITAVCLVVELLLQGFLKRRLEVGNRLWRASRARVSASAVMALAAFFTVARWEMPMAVTIGVSLFGAICATYCSLMSVIFGMSLQYWLGTDSDRGKISAIFRIAQALSITAGGLIAPAVFFGHPAAVLGLGLGICGLTLLLPTQDNALRALREVLPPTRPAPVSTGGG